MKKVVAIFGALYTTKVTKNTRKTVVFSMTIYLNDQLIPSKNQIYALKNGFQLRLRLTVNTLDVTEKTDTHYVD